MQVLISLLLVLFIFAGIPGCITLTTYNSLQRLDLDTADANSRLNSVYQKRADLIDNLANTVKGYAGHESDIHTKVAETRAGIGRTPLPANATAEDLSKFAQAQAAIGAGLGRLLAVAEAYPNLKADRNFMALQKDLGRIEQQATAARGVYIRSITAYNARVKTFPGNLVAGFFGFTTKPQLEFENERENKKSPRVTFGKEKT